MNLYSFKKIQISIASPKTILNLSNGEVSKPTTIDYKSLKPKEDGLFCSKIFGPIKDYDCSCGRYSGIKYKNITCSNCGVTVIESKSRRYRMGHIKLNSPIVHIWFLKILPSHLSLLLNTSYEQIEEIITSEGADVIYGLLKNIDLVDEYIKLKQRIIQLNIKTNNTNNFKDITHLYNADKYKKLIKRLKLIESFLIHNKRPEWMVLTVLPVIPPDLRPLVKMKDNVFVTSDLNYFYKSVIRRNNRLAMLINQEVPYNLIKAEKRMLQQAVDSLLDNVRSKYQVINKKKEPLKSLTERLGGKEGRFRHNLLGKRVDYSGRSVIISGPRLKLSQCGLPLYIILELFKPLIFTKLKKLNFLESLEDYKYKKNQNKIWFNYSSILLKEINNLVINHPVLLNRAPTLHRLNIQAFEPLLIHGKAIQLHPLVCSSFNADFDGDQMAVHLPLSLESQIEARLLMLSYDNILSPASGKAIITPSQDIIFGIYYTTKEVNWSTGYRRLPVFNNIIELQQGLISNVLKIHDQIMYIIKHNNRTHYKYKTTVGRVLLYNLVPNKDHFSFDQINKTFSKKDVQALVEETYNSTNIFEFLRFVDHLMAFGFYHTYQVGISLNKNELIVPNLKNIIVKHSIKQSNWYSFKYFNNQLSLPDYSKNIINIWGNCLNRVTESMMNDIVNTNISYRHTFYMLIDSGARGSITQMRQMCNLRGLMINPSGKVIDTPITSNFKEGLTILEYFVSTHGSRKGVIDTSIRTAAAGYLTRRLINASQNQIITNMDCYSTRGILKKSIMDGDQTLLPLKDRILGRTLAKDVINLDNGNVLLKRNNVINQETVKLLLKHRIEYVLLRSPLTCDQENGICKLCYGTTLTNHKLPKSGEAVGVIAAQSIGEPGTQLTMRTFHLGGILGSTNQEDQIIAPKDCYVLFKNANVLTTQLKENYLMTHKCKLLLIDSNHTTIAEYDPPYGSMLLHTDGAYVNKNETIVKWNPHHIPVISQCSGIVNIYKSSNISDNIKLNHITVQITHKNGESVRLFNGLRNSYIFNHDDTIFIQNKQKIYFGDIIGTTSRNMKINKDITGDISKISQLFEASKTSNPAIISPYSGYLKIENSNQNSLKISIKEPLSTKPNELKRSIKKHTMSLSNIDSLTVSNNEFVNKGDLLTQGNVPYEELLEIKGINSFINYFLTEIQNTYLNQGIRINDKHLEVILSKMLEHLKINKSYNEYSNIGNELTKTQFNIDNVSKLSQGYKVSNSQRILEGITQKTLKNPSFISAASFQNTSRVLTSAAAFNKIDHLLGPQENIIIGRLIPIGTGYLDR